MTSARLTSVLVTARAYVPRLGCERGLIRLFGDVTHRKQIVFSRLSWMLSCRSLEFAWAVACNRRTAGRRKATRSETLDPCHVHHAQASSMPPSPKVYVPGRPRCNVLELNRPTAFPQTLCLQGRRNFLNYVHFRCSGDKKEEAGEEMTLWLL